MCWAVGACVMLLESRQYNLQMKEDTNKSLCHYNYIILFHFSGLRVGMG